MERTIQKTTTEQIQQQSEEPEVSVQATATVDATSQLHAMIDDVAADFDVTGFKCVNPTCGLVHEHDTMKHRASDSFDMSEEEAASMQFNPNCHCSLNEVARLDSVADAPSPAKANSMAPVPGSVIRALDN
jgi:hypothetical protein